MGKTIIISEEQKKMLDGVDIEQSKMDDILAEAFCPSAEKVLLVKKFLDDNFTKGMMDDIDDMASPIKVPVLTRMMMGQPVEQLSGENAVLLLVDKFPKMVSNKDDLKKFMTQVIKDWYDNKISDTGVLSVNFMK